MLCTLVPVSAFAASSKLTIVDAVGANAKQIDMSADASGDGWTWKASKKTLTLKGFNGESISADGDMTVILSGKNTITLAKRAEYGIKVSGKLTIEKTSSSSSDTLTIIQKTTASASNLIMTGGVGEANACVINGGTVTLTNSTGGGNGSGIGYQAYVNNDASLIISVPYRGVASKLTANTTGKIDITTTGHNAFSAAVFGLDAKGKGTVSLKAVTPAVTVFDSLNIASTSGNVVLNGFTKVSSDPLNNFTVAYNKKLQESDTYYQGYYTSDASGNTGYYLVDSQGYPLASATYATAASQKLTVMDSPLFDLTELRVGTPVNNKIGLVNATRGGEGNYRYSLKFGSKLPDGLSLNATTGSISGTPSKACEAGSFTVICKDKKGGAGCSTAEVLIKYGAVKAKDEYMIVGSDRFNMNTDYSSQDYTYKYTAATKTLELKGYNGGPITADSGLNIILSGESTVTLPGTSEYGIRVNGKLTIDKSSDSITDILRINQTTTTTSANLIVTGGVGSEKPCVINGGNVFLNCSSSSKNGVGVSTWTYVNNDAMLTINAGYRGIESKLFAASSGVITVATLGLAEGSAAVGSLEATGTGLITLSAPASASTVFDALKVSYGTGKIILAGVTKVDSSPYSNISLAAEKQLADTDGNSIERYYLGNHMLGSAGTGYYITDANGKILPRVEIITNENQPLTVMSSTLFNIPATDVGTKLDTQMYLLNATRGGAGNYVYELKSGSTLPAGLTLNEKTGAVTGTPTAPCEPGAVSVVVKDKGGAAGCQKAEVSFTYGKIDICDLGVPTLSASNNAASGKPVLKWNAVPGAKQYELYRATSKSGTYSKIYTTASGTSVTNSSTNVGTTYYYKLKALGYDGTTTTSNIVSRCCDCARPVVTLSNVSSTGKIKLSWAKVTGAAKYEVYRATKLGGTYTKLTTTTGTSLTNTSANAGVTYYYKIKAIASKTSSANSAFSEIVSRICHCAQPAVKVTNISSTGKIKLSWAKVDGAVRYEIWRATSKNGTYTKLSTVTGTSLTNTSAKAGVTYYYKVKAIASDTDANSSFSAVVSRCCDCAQPVVTITLSSKKPKLSWKAVDGADKYVVYRASSKNGTYTKVTTVYKTSWVNSSALSGRSYFYKVKALSNASSSATSVYSSIVSITSK